MASGVGDLTAEQLRRMEESRQKALLKKAKIAAAKQLNQPSKTSINTPSTTQAKDSVNRVAVKLISNRVQNTTKLIKAKCVLMSNERFVVVVGYHQQLIEVFKTIPTRMFDIKTKNWSFDLKVHNQLIQNLHPLKSEVLIAPLPGHVLRIFNSVAPAKVTSDTELLKLDLTIKEALMTFQREGVLFGISREGRLLIADDMGLGKTIQALAIASYYRSNWPLLIVAPSSIRYSWLEAFQVWLPSVDPQTITVLNSGKDKMGRFQVYITSYEMMTKRKTELETRKFGVAIMDESHLLKNVKSARTKAATALLKAQFTIFHDCKRVILLSGTPALSRPGELYSQINLINRKIFPSHHDFGMRYCDGKQTPWGWDFSGASNTEELVLILKKECMIRRLKADVIKELPSKLRRMVVLDPSEISLSKNMSSYANLLSTSSLKGMERRGTLLTYFHETSLAKSKAVCNYISDLLESETKFLCFAHHKHMMDEICATITKTKCQFIRIDGSTSSEMRKKMVDRFQHSDDVRVAVLSITAANTGLTLTATQLVIFAELYWNPGILTQAEDRVHRIGQDNSVLIQYLVAKKTADDYLWLMIQDKLAVLSSVGLSKDNFRDADTMMVNPRDQRVIDDFLLLELDECIENTEPSPSLLARRRLTECVIMGGKSKKVEEGKLKTGINFVVATPGRLLYHLKNTPEFVYVNLQCLIIDVADRTLDVGFEREMKQILQFLPIKRQTMLFSATLTKDLIELADPIYVGVDQPEEKAIVDGLEQIRYLSNEKTVSDAPLFLEQSAPKRAKNDSVLVFYGEILNCLDLPVSTFLEFGNSPSSILLCTDVTARGKVIPHVDWIIQFDPPGDTKEYIHRIQHAARGARDRCRAILILRPEELGFLQYLKTANVQIDEHRFSWTETPNIQKQEIHFITDLIEEAYAKNPTLRTSRKALCQSFLRYYSAHYLKDVFDVTSLNLAFFRTRRANCSVGNEKGEN
uniref:SWI/SNF-related matrix-associated actin-dependent regulator of chromatin subfamily A-like protein 1 n=1 Tax=Strigamia maritima TaxID=126957 RepID=T1IRL8_STRMM